MSEISLEQRVASLVTRYDSINKRIGSLQASVEDYVKQQQTKQSSVLQQQHHHITSMQHSFENKHLGPQPFDTDDVRRVKQACKDLQLATAKFHKVPEDYYSRNLKQRAQLLGAPSIHMLCKSMILENTHCVNTDNSDPKNARFYCIIMQYTTKLSSDKVMRFLRELNGNKLGKRQFYFRLAHQEDQAKLTGFKFNAVAPVGMVQYVPLILSKNIVDNVDYIYLGGGEVDVKLEVSVKDFIKSVNPFVADVTDPDPTKTGDSSQTDDE